MGWQRRETALAVIEEMAGWVSPRLGIQFNPQEPELELLRPDGTPFASYRELNQQLETMKQQLGGMEQQLEAERQRSDRLAQRLRELGVDPEIPE